MDRIAHRLDHSARRAGDSGTTGPASMVASLQQTFFSFFFSPNWTVTGGGSGYAALLAHAGGGLYGMELGSVTLKRIGFFCFPIKHSTHTPRYSRLGSEGFWMRDYGGGSG